jgi:hypothetical protein
MARKPAYRHAAPINLEDAPQGGHNDYMNNLTDFERELLQRVRSVLEIAKDRGATEDDILNFVNTFHSLKASPVISLPVRQIYYLCGNKFPLPYNKRPDLTMTANKYLRREWGRCLDAGVLTQSVLRKLDNSLMKALEHQFAHRPDELCALIPNRSAVAAQKRDERDSCEGYANAQSIGNSQRASGVGRLGNQFPIV